MLWKNCCTFYSSHEQILIRIPYCLRVDDAFRLAAWQYAFLGGTRCKKLELLLVRQVQYTRDDCTCPRFAVYISILLQSGATASFPTKPFYLPTPPSVTRIPAISSCSQTFGCNRNATVQVISRYGAVAAEVYQHTRLVARH